MMHRARSNAIEFSPNGQWIAIGSDDQTVRLTQVSARREESASRLSLRAEVVAGAALSETGSVLPLSPQQLADRQGSLDASGGPPSPSSTVICPLKVLVEHLGKATSRAASHKSHRIPSP